MKAVGLVENERAALRRASVVVRLVTDMRVRRLRHLPDADELQRLGGLIERGDATALDFAVIRALPAQHLCANASAIHLRLFAEVRRANA